MPPSIDLSGQTFGKLTVIKKNGTRHNRPLWECQCSCGNLVYALAGDLRSGRPSQCKRCAMQIHIKHGCSPSQNQKPTREYQSWSGARSRCRNPKDKSFANYGGRGIVFSAHWDDFRNFLTDMGPCPEGYEIDRINNNGNYEPGNCRWAPESIQASNKRNNHLITYDGITLTITQWAEKLNTSVPTISSALTNGYTFEQFVYRIGNGLHYKKLKQTGVLK